MTAERSRLARLDLVLERITQRLAAIGVASVLVVAFLTVGDVLLRWLFKISLYGLNEISTLLIAIAVTGCLPSGVSRRVSLRIDLLDKIMSKSSANWLRAFGCAILALFFVLLAVRMGAVAYENQIQNETTIMTSIPVAPFFWGVAIGLGISALVQIVVTTCACELAFAGTSRFGWPILIIGGIGFLVFGALMFGVLPAQALTALIPENTVWLAGIMFVVMWVGVLLAIPLAAVMGLVGLIGTAAILGLDPALNVFGTETKRYLTQEALSALPFFLLMGTFASVAGVGADIYKLAYAMLGHLRGGLAHATIVGCAGFGAMTGSSMATQVTIGRVAMPEMRQRGYSTSLAAGSIAAGGTLGQLVPPGTAMILYAVMANESVGALFVGAILPGLLAMTLYMLAVAAWVALAPAAAPRGARTSGREIIGHVRDCWGALLLFALVIGGIYSGIFTNLEAGSVGAAGAFLLALLRGRITRKTLWTVMAETTSTVALMYTLLFGTAILSFFFGIAHLPDFFIDITQQFQLAPLSIVIFLIIVYLVLGTVMDPWASMVITIPIFVPMVVKSGFDPVWWGIMTIVCMEAGMIHPPFGINLFLMKSMQPDIPMSIIYRGCLPFFAVTLVKIALLVLFPAIVTWLPHTM